MDSVSSLLSRLMERLKPCPDNLETYLNGVVNLSICPLENLTGTLSGHNALKRKKENLKSGKKEVDAHLTNSLLACLTVVSTGTSNQEGFLSLLTRVRTLTQLLSTLIAKTFSTA